jgi:Flp pilus assembly protein CpaB
MFSFLKGRWTLWVIAMVFAGLAAGGSLLILGSATATKSYWVLEEDVAAGVEITSDMLFEKEGPVDAVPGQALTADEFTSSVWYSKIPLARGTVLQSSVLTDNVDFRDGLPAGFVVTSILVEPQNAVGGRISKGDFIDIAAVSGQDVGSSLAKVVLQKVLVVDVMVSPNDIAETANSRGQDLSEVGSEALYAGKPSMYILAVSPTDFSKLALIRNASLYLALSADQSQPVDTSIRGGDLFLPGSVDPSFTAPGASDNATADSASNTKEQVESFYNEYKAVTGVELSVLNGELLAVDPNGNILRSISLGNGTINLDTGVWSE